MALENRHKLVAMAVIAVTMIATTITSTDAQNIPSCASNLVPCVNFINSTAKPDSGCCNSIKETVSKELPCLCTLYNTPGLLSSFNITVNDALKLIRDCNISADLNSCKNIGAPSPSSSVPPPPATPGNGATTGRIAWTGITSSLILWAASVMLY